MSLYFAACSPGLEGLVERELQCLGCKKAVQRVEGGPSESEAGGVSFEGDAEALYRANLWLRTASRVLARLGQFHAASFSELYKRASQLEWERYLRPGAPVRLNVTCHRSRLYHSGAVAERVLAGIAERLGMPSPAFTTDSPPDVPVQLIVVRLAHDRCTISLDSSGELLHRRGYRLAGAKAPLRETLAAALLLASGWDTSAPLLDPFCGSGTIAIEAALLALGLPPGRNRGFAFTHWPNFDPAAWERILGEATKTGPARQALIQASDRDAGAVRMATENAARAGVGEAIEFSQRAFSAIQPFPGPGWVVTNPPFGVRVSQNKDLRNLYAQLGAVLRRACPGWRIAVLSADPRLTSQMGIATKSALSTRSGGLNLQLRNGRVPDE